MKRIGTLNTSNRVINARFRDIASSGDLNEFNEGVVRDVGELFDSVAAGLLVTKQLEDVVGTQVAALQGMINSMSASGVIDKVSIQVVSTSEYDYDTYGVGVLPASLHGAALQTCQVYIPGNVYQLVSGIDEMTIGLVTYGYISGLCPIYALSAGLKVEYWDETNGVWIRMTVIPGLPTSRTEVAYDPMANSLTLEPWHLDNQSQIRMSTLNKTTLTAGSIQEVASNLLYYYLDPESDVVVVNYLLYLPIGVGAAMLDITPFSTVAVLNAPADTVNLDFYAAPGVWTNTSARLKNMDYNVQYRILADSAYCHHDPLYGQITLPYTAEQDKCLIRSLGDILMPDTLKATTRVFRIHDKPIDGDESKRYYNILSKTGTPFNLQQMLNDTISGSISPELSTADILACFNQTDPLYAMDGDTATSAWYLSPFVDVDTALYEEAWPGTTHIVVFYDIEIPQDINSHMLFNVLQVHPMPIFGMHLIDVRYNVGEPFSEGELGKQFRMDEGQDSNLLLQGYSLADWQRNMIYAQPQDTILGSGQNIFWNTSYLELHVKRTEANFIRLVFAVEYNPRTAYQNRPLVGATHVGIYHREYKSTGAFVIEFEPEAGFDLATIGDNTAQWVDNEYALFNPDPSQEPQFAQVGITGQYSLNINFGIRTDDLSGTIKRFDNSATPSFRKITLYGQGVTPPQ